MLFPVFTGSIPIISAVPVPGIAFWGSLSLGAARYFEIRRKPRRGDTDRRLDGEGRSYYRCPWDPLVPLVY